MRSDQDPFHIFDEWMTEGKACGMLEPNAAALATCTPDGHPSVRMVLVKTHNARDGFVFYTNLESRKGLELRSNPRAALCFHWDPLRRQVRVEGTVEPTTAAEADGYFATRPRESRIGAWASHQSRPMESSMDLAKQVAKYALKFGAGQVPRPEWWSGFHLRPERIEFWRSKQFRLHDRWAYTRQPNGAWSRVDLYP